MSFATSVCGHRAASVATPLATNFLNDAKHFTSLWPLWPLWPVGEITLKENFDHEDTKSHRNEVFLKGYSEQRPQPATAATTQETPGETALKLWPVNRYLLATTGHKPTPLSPVLPPRRPRCTPAGIREPAEVGGGAMSTRSCALASTNAHVSQPNGGQRVCNPSRRPLFPGESQHERSNSHALNHAGGAQ